MPRRRSCFSCGEVQGGSGAFCGACGKPLDAPDLEFVSVENAAATGNDVVMSTGGGKGRPAMAIVAVLVVLGGVAAFSGKSTPTSTAASTTTALAKVNRTTTSTTAATTTPTTAEAALASERVLTDPFTLTTPVLPEKTGVKMLLVGLSTAGSGQRVNAVVDLDSGLVTPYPGADVSAESVVQTYGSSLVLADAGSGRLRFDTWRPTGPAGSVMALVENSDVFDPASILAGDVLWTMSRNPLVPENNVVRLVGYDVRDGHKVADAALPDSARLLGSDAANHPMVVDYGSGTYSFDPVTQQFARVTTNLAAGVRGDLRIERVCSDQLVCSSVVLNGADPPRSLPDLDALSGSLSVSPDGQTVVQASYRNGGPPTLEAIDVIAGSRKKLGMEADSYPIRLAWSADGRWLFGLRNGVLSAWKVGTTDTLSLAFDGDPVRVSSFGVFPA